MDEIEPVTLPVEPPKPRHNFLKFLVVLIISSALASSTYWLVARSGFKIQIPKKSAPPTEVSITETATESAEVQDVVESGFKRFRDKASGFEFEFPENWQQTQIENGVRIASGSASIEIVLSQDRPYSFTDEEAKNLSQTTFPEVEIGGKKLKVNEHQFSDGSFFIAAVLLADGSKPQVTFWLKGADLSQKEQTISIIQSANFNQ